MIAKYSLQYGLRKTARKFQKQYPSLNESTVRTFVTKYKTLIKIKARTSQSPIKGIGKKRQGRPLMLGILDKKVRDFLVALRHRGGVVNSTIAIATAKGIIRNSPNPESKKLIINTSWAQSLFRRMGFVRRMATTAKIPIPDKARKEIEFVFMHKIVNKVEKHNIPDSLIINADQTPSKYVPVGRTTLAKKNTKDVPISGSADKRSITATFAETLDGTFLPFQLIYKGKTKQSLPKVDFPSGFSLSANDKHFSNTQESVKFLNEIIIPFVDKKRSELKRPNQAALLIWDVFRGQKTTPVLDLLKENNIVTEYVPSNMTNYYQPLDCTTNKWAKDFLKAKFSTWFAKQVQNHLDNGTALEDIDIKFQLTTMKPLHAHWLKELYNELTSTRAKDVVIGGWKKSGIWDANMITQPKPKIRTCQILTNQYGRQPMMMPTVMLFIFLESRFAVKLSNPEKSHIFCAS